MRIAIMGSGGMGGYWGGLLAQAGTDVPTHACWTCGREVAPMRFRAEDLRPHGWAPAQTFQIPDWCGCSTEYLPVPVGDGWWLMVPIWEPGKAANPLLRYEPAAPR
jgi:Ketopantoate reductase PanE/ApbA